MALAIAGIISAAQWAFIWFVVLGGSAESATKNIQNFGAAVTKGPVSTAVNAYMLTAGFVAVLGGLIWYGENKYARHIGQEVAAPPLESIHVPSPPSFGSQGGFSVQKGGVGVNANVGTSSGGGDGGRGVGSPGRPIKTVTTKKTTKRSAFGR